MVLKRGALIVIEGVDRTGKTTQCKKLVECLRNKKIQAEYTNFPDRSTEIGKVINSYLKSKKELSDETIHLLFSANRWEKANSIIKTLEDGITLIVDRYCYSGVAFSAAKDLNVNWCKIPDSGLPKPDHVFFLNMSLENVQQRNGFGNERYEVLDFQKKVANVYMQLKEENWEVLDASRSMEIIQEELFQRTLAIIDSVGDKPIGKIWV
ncbi:thymidylate kinase [Vanessa atalanta]|uniref:thymidylate kinase n=1 Tax=Vanessa atalanta TaxID=42275 RepID=UPI001FCCE4C6|nr:thymidylate kinase [Vanessa atalanta]